MAKKRDTGLPRKLLVHGVLSDMMNHKTHLYITTVELAKFIATISGIILTVSLGKMATEGFLDSNPLIKVGVLTVVGFSLLSICMSLLVIEPNVFKDHDANAFDYGTKISEITEKDYFKSLKKTVENKEKILQTYSNELYSLDTIIVHRFKNIRAISYIFLLGIGVGGLLIIFASLLV